MFSAPPAQIKKDVNQKLAKDKNGKLKVVEIKKPKLIARPFVYSSEAVDDPAYWMSEAAYYRLGEVSPLPDAAAALTPTEKPWYETLITGAVNLYQTYEVANANRERANAGLPPITNAQYAATQIPANVVPPQTQQGVVRLSGQMTATTKTMLAMGAVLVGFMIFKKGMR